MSQDLVDNEDEENPYKPPAASPTIKTEHTKWTVSDTVLTVGLAMMTSLALFIVLWPGAETLKITITVVLIGGFLFTDGGFGLAEGLLKHKGVLAPVARIIGSILLIAVFMLVAVLVAIIFFRA